MKAKIEWYQEVLELEPGSKVFFALARLLGQTGEAEEAIRVLRQGLALHPDYIEARLLLVQLLWESGDSSECAEELSEITDVFVQYPGFWKAWSAHSPTDDVACALNFLAAVFRSPDLSLRGLFEAGLRELDGVEPSRRAQGHRGRRAGRAPAASLPAAQEEHDEPSVRTRTMAEVLAEQGDIQGAVDIYHEILASGAFGDEEDKLRARLAELAARLGPAAEPANAPAERARVAGETKPAKPAMDPAPAGIEETAASVPETPEFPEGASPAENPMRDMLEKLARRLDARAQA